MVYMSLNCGNNKKNGVRRLENQKIKINDHSNKIERFTLALGASQ